MRISTAYFAGVGTVVAAVAAGLGGGYLAANVVNPHEPGVSKLERRMSATPIAATTAPSEPVRIAGTTAAATNPVARASRCSVSSSQPQQTAATAGPQHSQSIGKARAADHRLQCRRARRREDHQQYTAVRSVRAREAAEQASEKPSWKRPPRLRKPSPVRVTPTSSGRLLKSGGPNAASAGKRGAVSGSLASRSWRRSRRKSGRLPSRGRPSPSNR